MMNKKNAKSFLYIYPPATGNEDADPEMREALDAAQQDPELSEWFDREKAFDRSVAETLNTFPAPERLQEEIVAGARPSPILFPWLFLRNAAAAAAVLIVAAGTSLYLLQQAGNPIESDRAHEARQAAQLFPELVGLFDREPNFDFYSTDVPELQSQASAHGAPDFNALPSGLDKLEGYRCRVYDWENRKMALICLQQDRQRMHLFIYQPEESDAFADEEEAGPLFGEWGNWGFAHWNREGKTFILTTQGDRKDIETLFY